MKQKVAIVTPNHGFNYGNKLQNYAVQRIYEEMGMEPETIRFYPKGLRVESTGVKKDLPHYAKSIKNRVNKKIFAQRVRERLESFENFNNNVLKMTSTIYTPQTYHTIKESEYDYFSVGSDQVWNTYFFDFTPIYLLDFASDNSKKIAFAASFGVDNISQKYFGKVISELKKFKAISVREQKGVDILRQSAGISSTFVLDPTLFLSADRWVKAIEGVKMVLRPRYVLTYFLGGLNKNTEEEIYMYARENNCEVICLNNLSNKYYIYGPFEFVYLIQHAELVYTDSFHAICFSLQFHRKFIAVPRISEGVDMSSRLSSLLDLVGLQNRIWSYGKRISEDIDFCSVDKILEEERRVTQRFLFEAFTKEV